MVLGFSQFGREASAIAQQGWLIARRIGRPLPSPTGERVALFVHGFMASGAVFDPMRARVSSATGLATLDFSYGLFERFESIAERLARTIEESVPRGVAVSLVGHSLGGLVARWYIQELSGRARVDRLVTLATPHGGTLHARIAPGPLRDVLMPGSHVLRRLGTTVSNGSHFPHTVIVPLGDRLISPIASASAVEDARITHVSDVGHNEALFSPSVHTLVVEALR